MDVADAEPFRVCVRCSALPSWGIALFQGFIEDEHGLETMRSPCFDNRVSMAAWLVVRGVGEDRAEWLIDQVLDRAEEGSSDGATDPEY